MHAEIALNQNADGVASGFFGQLARSRPSAALPFEADHSGAAADVAFGDGATVSICHRRASVFGGDVETIDVVQVAIPGFGNDGQRPPIFERERSAVLQLPGDDRVADD